MKKMIFLSVLCFVQIQFFAQGNENALEIKEIKPNHYLFITYKLFDGVLFPANGMYIVGDSSVVMIDTPWNKDHLQSLLDSIQARHHKKVSHCFSTHFHDDRTGGLEYYAGLGIKTYSSRKTKELCLEKKQAVAENSFLKDTSFNISGIHFETFFPGKGHTADNIVLYFPDSNILYGGCFVKSIENSSLGFIGDAYVKEWKKSVKRVIHKYGNSEIVIPGHFAYSDSKSLQHTIDIIKAR